MLVLAPVTRGPLVLEILHNTEVRSCKLLPKALVLATAIREGDGGGDPLEDLFY